MLMGQSGGREEANRCAHTGLRDEAKARRVNSVAVPEERDEHEPEVEVCWKWLVQLMPPA